MLHEGSGAKPAPYRPHYPDRFSGNPLVSRLTLAGRGLHVFLLDLAWQGFDLQGQGIPCSIPRDVDLLKAACREDETWNKVWSAVKLSWIDHDGRYWNLELCDFYLEQKKYITAQSERGKKGAMAKHRKEPKKPKPNRVKRTTHPSKTPPPREELGAIRRDVKALDLPASERIEINRLLDNPTSIDPQGHRPTTQNDEPGMRIERIHLLAHLAHVTVHEKLDGGGDDKALALWGHWRKHRKQKHKQAPAGHDAWLPDVKTLRKLVVRGPQDILNALDAGLTNGWQGFEWDWVDQEKDARGGRPVGSNAGYISREDPDIDL